MALIQLATPFYAISGNIAGLNVRRRGPQHVLAKARSRHSADSQRHQDNSALLSQHLDAWNALNAATQNLWTIYARTHKATDRVGNMTVRPPLEWFRRWYKYAFLTVAGHTTVHFEPPYEDRLSLTAGTLSLTFDTTPSYVIEPSAGLIPFGYSKLEVHAARWANAGARYCKFTRFLGFKAFIAYSTDCTSLWTNAGENLSEGETVYVKARWAVYDHWPGPWSYATTVVTAP